MVRGVDHSTVLKSQNDDIVCKVKTTFAICPLLPKLNIAKIEYCQKNCLCQLSIITKIKYCKIKNLLLSFVHYCQKLHPRVFLQSELRLTKSEHPHHQRMSASASAKMSISISISINISISNVITSTLRQQHHDY